MRWRLSRPPVTIKPSKDGMTSTLARTRWMRCDAVSLGKFIAANATAPATWGEAMDVPLRYWYNWLVSVTFTTVAVVGNAARSAAPSAREMDTAGIQLLATCKFPRKLPLVLLSMMAANAPAAMALATLSEKNNVPRLINAMLPLTAGGKLVG